MSNAYIDERLLGTACLSDFPELHADFKEHYPKMIGDLPQLVPKGEQLLQQQVKNNDDIIYASNQVFEPLVPNAITKLDLISLLVRQVFLASSSSDPQLIVYGNRITLTASYETTDVRPKADDQVIALVVADDSNTYAIVCYIDQNE
ncbi:MAG: hypothetical protein EZS28_014749 [Streblomastix strix]|uniref:Uncharacterized protein n=1 Tax=Streblomastix strix TaxID=222440 RepID=A0A5J4W5A8_9EUKA|nr:MAG: hypothetical protein EZS28_014749 [Streblomastix strix]